MPVLKVEKIASFEASIELPRNAPGDFGNLEPRVVLSLWDAYRLLGLDEPDFQAIR